MTSILCAIQIKKKKNVEYANPMELKVEEYKLTSNKQ